MILAPYTRDYLIEIDLALEKGSRDWWADELEETLEHFSKDAPDQRTFILFKLKPWIRRRYKGSSTKHLNAPP